MVLTRRKPLDATNLSCSHTYLALRCTVTVQFSSLTGGAQLAKHATSKTRARLAESALDVTYPAAMRALLGSPPPSRLATRTLVADPKLLGTM